MAVLFVSHSSKDNAAATALEKWLCANGFDDPFVDHQKLAGGAKWREDLRAYAGACRVVVCLVTRNWLASNECFNEFRAAWYMGKRIIPLFLLPPTPDLGDEAKQRFAEVCAEDQKVDLNSTPASNRARFSTSKQARMSRAASRWDYAPPARLRALVWIPKLSRSTASCVRCRSRASPRSATMTPTPRCSTAAAAKSRRRWKSCARYAPNGT